MEYDNINFSVSAPGKLILMGEHSVVYNKKGIAVAINKKTYLHFKEHKQAHEQIKFNLKNIDSITEWDFKSVYDLITNHKPLVVENLKEFNLFTPELLKHDEYVNLLKQFVLKKEVNYEQVQQKSLLGLLYVVIGMLWCTDVNITPFDIEIVSELTLGFGTGSSASFSVCCAAAMYHYIRLKGMQKHGVGEFNISYEMFKPFIITLSQQYSGFTAQDKEVINKWAYCIEKVIHETPSGLDNTICTFGHSVLINMTDISNEFRKFQLMDTFPPLRILLVNSDFGPFKFYWVGAALRRNDWIKEICRVERSCSELITKVKDLRSLFPETIDEILNSMDRVSLDFIKLMTDLKEREDHGDVTSTYSKMEVLIDIFQCLLKSLGVSHKRNDRIIEICAKGGLHAKLTGAGGGGYCFAVLSPSVSEGAIDKTVTELNEDGFTVEEIIINCEGVTLDIKSP